MLTPVVSIDGVKLYRGDSRVVLPEIDIPDDAGWIIDPPLS